MLYLFAWRGGRPPRHPLYQNVVGRGAVSPQPRALMNSKFLGLFWSGFRLFLACFCNLITVNGLGL